MLALPILLVGFIRAVWGQVRKDEEVRGLLYLTVLLLTGGALFYWSVEGWSLFDSFYFCVVTLATVGYGDFTPQTVPGKVFTMLYIVTGIGVLLGFINKVAESRPAAQAERRQRRAQRRATQHGDAAGDSVAPLDDTEIEPIE